MYSFFLLVLVTLRFRSYRGSSKPFLTFSTHAHNWERVIEFWAIFSAVVLTFFPCSLRSSLPHSEIKSFLHFLRESTFVCLPACKLLHRVHTHTHTRTVFFLIISDHLGELLCFALSEFCLSLHLQLTTHHKSKRHGEQPTFHRLSILTWNLDKQKNKKQKWYTTYVSSPTRATRSIIHMCVCASV